MFEVRQRNQASVTLNWAWEDTVTCECYTAGFKKLGEMTPTHKVNPLQLA